MINKYTTSEYITIVDAESVKKHCENLRNEDTCAMSLKDCSKLIESGKCPIYKFRKCFIQPNNFYEVFKNLCKNCNEFELIINGIESEATIVVDEGIKISKEGYEFFKDLFESTIVEYTEEYIEVDVPEKAEETSMAFAPYLAGYCSEKTYKKFFEADEWYEPTSEN